MKIEVDASQNNWFSQYFPSNPVGKCCRKLLETGTGALYCISAPGKIGGRGACFSICKQDIYALIRNRTHSIK